MIEILIGLLVITPFMGLMYCIIAYEKVATITRWVLSISLIISFVGVLSFGIGAAILSNF